MSQQILIAVRNEMNEKVEEIGDGNQKVVGAYREIAEFLFRGNPSLELLQQRIADKRQFLCHQVNCYGSYISRNYDYSDIRERSNALRFVRLSIERNS